MLLDLFEHKNQKLCLFDPKLAWHVCCEEDMRMTAKCLNSDNVAGRQLSDLPDGLAAHLHPHPAEAPRRLPGRAHALPHRRACPHHGREREAARAQRSRRPRRG